MFRSFVLAYVICNGLLYATQISLYSLLFLPKVDQVLYKVQQITALSLVGIDQILLIFRVFSPL